MPRRQKEFYLLSIGGYRKKSSPGFMYYKIQQAIKTNSLKIRR